MSAKETTNGDHKEEPRPAEDIKKIEEEVLSSPATEPGKKKRKLNDGSSTEADEQSTSFFSSLGNFLTGKWLWSSPTSVNADTPAATTKTAEEKEPSEPTKADEKTTEEEGSAKPKLPTEKTTDEKEEDLKASATVGKDNATEEEEHKDSATVTNSSVASDDVGVDDVEHSGDDADKKVDAKEFEKCPSNQKKKVIRAKSESPKSVSVKLDASRKRRRLS